MYDGLVFIGTDLYVQFGGLLRSDLANRSESRFWLDRLIYVTLSSPWAAPLNCEVALKIYGLQEKKKKRKKKRKRKVGKYEMI